MSVSPLTLSAGSQLTNAAATYYTCPANSKVVIRHAVFCNVDSGSNTFTAHVIPSGGSLSSATMLVDAQSITAGAAYVSSELAGVVLNAGDIVQLLASASSKITANLSGILYT